MNAPSIDQNYSSPMQMAEKSLRKRISTCQQAEKASHDAEQAEAGPRAYAVPPARENQRQHNEHRNLCPLVTISIWRVPKFQHAA